MGLFSKLFLGNIPTIINNKQFVLVITCLEGQLGINCPSAFLKTLKFQNFQKSQGWFIKKIARTKHVITG